MSRRSFLILSLFASLAACVGCSVPRKVTWLPDSSGFVDTKSDGTIVRYDIKENKRHTVAKAKTGTTRVPGVSPDGKRFAVVNVVATDTDNKVTVTMADSPPVTIKLVDYKGKVLTTFEIK